MSNLPLKTGTSWTREQIKADTKRIEQNREIATKWFCDQLLPDLLGQTGRCDAMLRSSVCLEAFPKGTIEKRWDMEYGQDYKFETVEGKPVYAAVRMSKKQANPTRQAFTIRVDSKDMGISELKILKHFDSGIIPLNSITVLGVQNQQRTETLEYHIVNTYRLFSAVFSGSVRTSKPFAVNDNSEIILVNICDVKAAGIKVISHTF
jgi:hypothetical protein